MPLSPTFSIEIHPAAFRARYAEPQRHVLLRLELDPGDNWLLRPETVGWWENRRGLRYPVQDDERETIIARVVSAARDKHRLWLNVAGRPLEPRPDTWPGPPPLRAPVDADPEVFAAAYAAAEDIEDPNEPKPDPAMLEARRDKTLLAQIEQALARIQPLADQGWAQAQSIARQLRWCRGKLLDEPVENPPGPLSMGLIATREFDMYGSDPDLARLINDIQDGMALHGVA